jgi:uncharacterized repeat protein (TIGR01451 family)
MCCPARRKTSHQFVLPLLAYCAILFLAGCASGTNPASPPQNQSNPVPSVASVTPATIATGTKGTTLTINGAGFVQGSVVQWNQNSRPTTFVNSGQLKATLSDTDTTTAGNAQVNVVNPTPGGGSSAITIVVLIGAPQITALVPDSIAIGSPNTLVSVNGGGFVSKSVVTVNGAPRMTKFISSSQLQFTLAASELTLSGFEQVSVANPDGTSASPFELTVLYPSPTLTSINPSAVNATDPAQTLTVSGSSFTFASLVAFNGNPQPTTFVNSTTLTVPLNPADPSLAGSVQITVKTPPPGGGTTSAAILSDKYPVPVLASTQPDSVNVGATGVSVALFGTGFTPASAVQINGTPVSDVGYVPPYGGQYGSYDSELIFTLPDSYAASIGDINITASNPGTATSNVLTISVIPNAAPIVGSVYPAAAGLGSGDLKITVSGQNFVPSSVVQWNGQALNTTFTGPFQLNAVIPAQDLQILGNNEITVSSPSPGGGISSSQVFTTYLSLQANALVYSPVSQLLYAATPSTAGPQLGNSIVPIDPSTGVLGTPIYVGSEPDKMALSSDGKKLWVSLHGAAAVREVDLTTQTAGVQFSLGGGVTSYSPPSTAALAVVPGQDDSVAVALTNAGYPSPYLAVYDSGVARPRTEPVPSGTFLGTNAIAFDSTGTRLYQVGQGFGYASVDSTGITQVTQLNANLLTYNLNDLRIDSGLAYLPLGITLDASTGNQTGEFLVAQNQPAYGPIIPDSAIGKVFILANPNFSSGIQINVYDKLTLNLQGSIPVAGVNFSLQENSSTFQRWGQNGLAFSTGSQIYILRSSLVRDLSTALADLSLTGSAPAASTTGTNLTFTLTVANSGPVTASPVTLIDNIPDGSVLVSTVPSAGTCSGGNTIYCNLGDLPSGSSTTVQVTVTPLNAATLSNTAIVSAPQGDPNPANNVVVTSSVATGVAYSANPVLSSISPEFIQAGSPTTTLTVNGSNFTSSSTVQLGSVSLPTTLVNSNQLTATVDASNLAKLGWAWVSVSSSAPGGGTSAVLPLSVYQVVSLDSNRMHYDPFGRKLYFSVPSTATQVEGNSIVSVDPYTGTIGTPVFVGSEPNPIAETGDGRYLYVGLDGAQSLTRVDLTNSTQGPVFPLVLPDSSHTSAINLAVAPTNNNLLAIDVNDQVGLFDISGSAGKFRPALNGYYGADNLAFWTDTYLFSFTGRYGNGLFNRWEVTSTGAALIGNTGYTLNGFSGTYGGYELVNNTVYGFNGGVANPISTPPTQLGQFMVNFAQGQYVTTDGVAADPAAGRVFFLGQASGANSVLLSFDSNRYVLLDASSLVGSSPGIDLVRWGRDGLAWHSSPNGIFGANAPGSGQLYLLRGPFVLPQWGTPNPTPVLSSLSPSTVPAGINGGTLVVTGSSFVPGAVVLWNGSERETTFVNSGKLTVAIPATDVSNAGNIILTVNNPGTAASNQLTLQIH